ncbi:MAG TPA: zinc ribbon domain-containing protein [Pyrinomonadaceae bacterium]|nr:zinc ribbon domain-containing protein [Pyrinomonadaceae bacterium]
MDVTCQKCGASVPAENAFCAECGAVMLAGAPRERRDDPSAQLASTISGAYVRRELAPEPTATAPAAVAPTREARAGAPQESRRSSPLLLVVGVAALIALGGLLVYLVGLILRG